MNWSDERWIKVYTRDTTDWLGLSWQAQGLFCLILRKVDRAGVLELGRRGKAGLASHLGGGAAWVDLEAALDELLADGCIELMDTALVVRNFIEAQETKQSDRVRQAESRSRRRNVLRTEGVAARGGDDDESEDGPECHSPSPGVTDGHALSPGVTDGHTPSRNVTTRVDKSRRDESRRDEITAAGQPTPPTAFRLEGETATAASKAKPSPAQKLREELRTMRATALPGVVDDIEIKPAALTRTFDRLQQEATAKEVTVVEAYSAYLLDNYARSRNPPCPLGLFVDGNKFRECLSVALRGRGKGPALTLVSNRKPGSYASLAEIEAQEFTVDPVEGDQVQETP